MTNKNWLRIPVIVLVFGLMVASCDDGSTDNSTNGDREDPALNGTWVVIDGTWLGNGADHSEVRFNNGNFEVWDGDFPYEKGTYSTLDTTLFIYPTHYYGKFFMLESKWYTKDQLITSAPLAFNEDVLKHLFSVSIRPYSVSGKNLTILGTTYTKK